MSAGAFLKAKYECDDGTIAVILVQPETIGLTMSGNDSPVGQASGDVTGKTRIRSSKSKRSYGVAARTATFEWTGAVPDGYKLGGIIRLPILLKNTYNDMKELDAGTYRGSPVRMISKSPESAR